MNSVNLMPREARRSSHPSVSISPQSLGLFTLLLAVLGATVLYVSAHGEVTSRRAELSRVTAATQRWSAAAARSQGAVTLLQQRRNEVSEVRDLVVGQYDWSRLLSQIAGVLPAQAGLMSLTAGAADSSSPGAQLSGCAASQSTVAATMVALRKLTGISNVTLSSSLYQPGGGGTKCYLPFEFNISLWFTAPRALQPATTTAPATTAGTAAADETGAAQ